MGRFDAYKNADVMGARSYIVEGDHYFLVKRAEQSPSTNPKSKATEKTIIDFKILKTDTMRVGSMTAFVDVDTSQGYLGNIVSCVAGILGYKTPQEFQADDNFESCMESVFDVEQILVGMIVHCIAQNMKTKEKLDYTVKTWEPYEASKYEAFGLIAPDGAYTGEDSAAP